jgi:hypothetical protein
MIPFAMHGRGRSRWPTAGWLSSRRHQASVNASVNAMIAMAIVYLFPPATALIVLTLAWAGLAGVLGWQMRRCIKPSAKAATARSFAASNRTDRP